MEDLMHLFERDALSVNVGERLRALREERGISMRSLARLSGLSANALSMIERGLTSPSVSTLTKLANAMEVPICAFFREEPERKRVVFVKAGDRARIPFQRGLWEGLGGERFSGRMEAFALTLESGSSSGPHGMLHTGHEFVVCLRGTIEYEVEQERYVLEPGDNLIFAARMTHRWRNSSNKVANAIIVISGFEEGERPAAYHMASARAGERAHGTGIGDKDLEDDGEGEENHTGLEGGASEEV
jgi:transcriptional regulator with XRE-family HTH domain